MATKAGLAQSTSKASTAAASSAVASKKSKKEAADDEDALTIHPVTAPDDKMTVLLAKLALSQARELAMVKACLVHVVIFDKTTPLGKAISDQASATGKDYLATVKQLTPEKKQSFGSPHVFVWLDLVDKFTEQATTLSCPSSADPMIQHDQELMKQVEIICQKEKAAAAQAVLAVGKQTGNPPPMPTWDPTNNSEDKQYRALTVREVTAEQVKVCRVQKCYNPSMARLDLHVTPQYEPIRKIMFNLLCQHAKGQVKHSQAPKGDLERRIAKLMPTKPS